MSRRTERVGEQIRAELARLLREEVRDPRVVWVTLTRVDVAPDLSHAWVGWSVLAGPGAADVEATGRGLASAAPFLRRRLAAHLATKRVPELRFRHDPSLAEGGRILALLAEVGDDADPPE